MKATLDRKPRVLLWNDRLGAVAPDGYVYVIFDDWNRHEPRVYWPMVTPPGGVPSYRRISDREWCSKETAMNAAERHAREHHAEPAPPEPIPQGVVFVVTRGLSDSNNDPVSEIVGVFSTPEKARAAAEANAPRSGWVDQYVIDSIFSKGQSDPCT